MKTNEMLENSSNEPRTKLDRAAAKGRRFKYLPGVPSAGIPSTLAEIQRLAAISSRDAINQLTWLMKHAEKQEVRMAASNAILDRAFGKPNQPLDVSLDDTASLSLEDRDRFINLMAALLAPPLELEVKKDPKTP